jgi:ribosomal protein L11 methyltransferase
VVESSALLKRRTSKGYRGFESLPHRQFLLMYLWRKSAIPRWLSSKAIVGLVVIERPGRKRLQLEVCCKSATQARRLVDEFGGHFEKLPRDWLERFSREQEGEPIKIGKRLVAVRSTVGETSAFRVRAGQTESRHRDPSHLIIPAGAAFGTGDHVTTAMSLRLLEEVSRKMKPGWSLADLGTGSGILALAAKRFGAGRVIAIDNDRQAIKTAKANARINRIDRIDFRIDDVRRWQSPCKIDIVTANLFSELLIEILPKLKCARRLILSGILHSQERAVRHALRANKIDIARVRRRGKWIAILCSGPECFRGNSIENCA